MQEDLLNPVIRNAHYIKLGSKGKWAEECLKDNIVRIGWSFVSIEDIQSENWEVIKTVVEDDYRKRDKKNGSTQDYKALEKFCKATRDDIFITFYKGKMFWCRLDDSPIDNDSTSKYRKTLNGWSCNPLNSNKELLSNEISGRISKTQAFQGTVCSYTDKEKIIILRLLNGEPDENVNKITSLKNEILEKIECLFKELYWKDCEILADLIFQQGGWRKISMSGGSMEFIDMEYVEPINDIHYAVQVKSGANAKDVEEYNKKLEGTNFEKMFLVIFHPDDSINEELQSKLDNVEILYGKRLASYIFDLGLLNWLLKKSW